MDITEVHQHALNAFKELKRIFNKYDIQYYFIGGSALGAVRHGGFIPWDDDIDIGIPRKDYERFIKICSKELDSKFFLQSIETDKYYLLPFIKIRVKGTEEKFIDLSFKGYPVRQGVFIDIFPLDNLAEKNFQRNLQFLIINVCNKARMARFIDKNESIFKRCIKKIVTIFTPLPLIEFLTNNFAQKYNNVETEYFGNFFSSYGVKKEMFPRNYFGRGVLKKFEDEMVIIPENYDKYLKLMYGDYMEMPKKGEQKSHSKIN